MRGAPRPRVRCAEELDAPLPTVGATVRCRHRRAPTSGRVTAGRPAAGGGTGGARPRPAPAEVLGRHRYGDGGGCGRGGVAGRRAPGSPPIRPPPGRRRRRAPIPGGTTRYRRAHLADGEQISVADSVTGVTADVILVSTDWGTQISFALSSVTGPRDCQLLVVRADGSTETAGSWHVPETGYGTPARPEPLMLQVPTATARSDLAAPPGAGGRAGRCGHHPGHRQSVAPRYGRRRAIRPRPPVGTGTPGAGSPRVPRRAGLLFAVLRNGRR